MNAEATPFRAVHPGPLRNPNMKNMNKQLKL